ncbi:ABC transporter permease [Desulfobacterota bacterium AH_259_B03_O07]|nr:ABC transporter permease [Desulfobacterota bacterium AH_259_B03_O07]
MDFRNVYILIRKEARDSVKNWWFVLYTICFSALALLLLFLASSRSEIAGFSGFGRTAASLINLVLLFIPLIALVTGAISISNERENGTLSYLLSHPITKSEIFTGKFIGLLLSIWFSISLGFGLAGIAISIRGGGGDISKFLMTAVLSAILAASLLSVGFLISVFSKKAAKATGIAVFLWLVFIVIGDLGIMGSTVAMDLGIKQVFILALFNPTEVFKIASVLTLSPRFEVLGPVGIYAFKTFGREGLFYLLLSVMALWILIPLGYAFLSFSVLRREEL